MIRSIADSMTGKQKITCLYKNGMDGCGFKKNVIGTGVSVLEKKDIYDGVFSYIADIVRETEGISRVGSTKRAVKKLKLDTLNLNRELTKDQRLLLARRMKTCTESDHLTFEVYATDDTLECAEKIMEKLESVFVSCEEMTFTIKRCRLGSMGEPMKSSKSADALKRIHEIEKELSPATELTACIVVLPGKECFHKLGDPKGINSLRHGVNKPSYTVCDTVG